ncbi:MAG: sulfatase-like hydrolase/transferase [Methylococcaceae bacterium]|nr:sulfatase-like hydrolase/transferase [Methylococcaceae bacterium]
MFTVKNSSPVRYGALSEIYNHDSESRKRFADLNRHAGTLVDDFWAAGYDTFCAGKIFHDTLPNRWTEYFVSPTFVDTYLRKNPDFVGRFDPAWISPYDGVPIGTGQDYSSKQIDFGPIGKNLTDPDRLTAEWARSVIQRGHERPFFLAFGTFLPRLPWRVPQEFIDRHPLDRVVVPEWRPDDLDDLPDYALHKILRRKVLEILRQYNIWGSAVQAYQAAISYADALVGSVLSELAASPYAADTIVVLWSDHGFHLGEKLHFKKFTLWERATRVPFLIHAPSHFGGGIVFERPVSLLDLGPTLLDLCNIEQRSRHDGASLLPMVGKPDLADLRPPITTWEKGNHAVRRGAWRYIQYRTGETELYDHRNDPDEYVNLARSPEYAAVQADLQRFVPRSG